MQSSIQKSFQVLFLSLATVVLVSGCAKEKDFESIAREQAATIQSLNKEVARLNAEMDAVMDAQNELAIARDQLEKQLKEELASGEMSVEMQDRGLVVTMLSSVLFDSGKADLKESALESLEKVGTVAAEKAADHVIYVEGHTDNVPITYSGWKSNWELSTGRATEVIHFFVNQSGVKPDRIAAVGYGEFHPVESNDTEEGRYQNRRVEIVISPKKV